MIRSFADSATEDIFHGVGSKSAMKRLPLPLVSIARRKLDMLHAAAHLGDLRVPPANRLEKLKGNRRDQYSIRINDQYRIVFAWGLQGPQDVEIVDYH